MIDDATLARHARAALAETGGGTLHVHGLGRLEARIDDVLLYDADGRPSFLCEPGSPVSDAAARCRWAVLSISPRGHDDLLTSVVLAGRLAVVGSEDVEGRTVHVVALVLDSVIVERDDPTEATVTQREVALSEWTAAAPDPVDQMIGRIVRHTNEAHGAELRAFVAGLRGLPESEIAAAELAGLDETGADLRWLDRRGSHDARVRFARPALGTADLARRLRQTLTG
jgi:hypothetical protein